MNGRILEIIVKLIINNLNNLYIKGTSQTPHIDFRINDEHSILTENLVKDNFVISGRSVPEDCDIYYYPVLRFLEIYNAETKGKKINFEFRLIYYNTTSIRYLNSVMSMLEKISAYNDIIIEWYYDTDDEYLEEMGHYFKESYDVNFVLVKQIPPPKKIRKH